MTRKSLPLWILLSILWIGGGTYLYNVKGNPTAGVSDSDVKAAAAAAVATTAKKALLVIKDGEDFLTKSVRHQFQFSESQHTIASPLNENVLRVVEETSAYLKSNPMKTLLLSGNYNSSEKNSSAFANIGLGRASAMKAMFVAQGVNSNQLQIASKLNDDLSFGTEDAPVPFADFSIIKTEDQSTRLKEIKSKFDSSPMRLYFQFNSDNLDLSLAQREGIGELMFYLDNSSDGKLVVSGHTDNVGGLDANYNLAKERADMVRNYLGSNGLDVNAMTVKSFGPDKPINTNDTPEGRMQNRRVEISIK